jgi:hypothetical protein
MMYTKLSKSEKKSIADRFILPSDKSQIRLTKEGIPYELIHNCKVACTVNTRALIGSGFHNHAIRN